MSKAMEEEARSNYRRHYAPAVKPGTVSSRQDEIGLY